MDAKEQELMAAVDDAHRMWTEVDRQKLAAGRLLIEAFIALEDYRASKQTEGKQC